MSEVSQMKYLASILKACQKQAKSADFRSEYVHFTKIQCEMLFFPFLDLHKRVKEYLAKDVWCLIVGSFETFRIVFTGEWTAQHDFVNKL